MEVLMLTGLKKKFYSSNTVLRQLGKYSSFNKDIMDAMENRFRLLAEDNNLTTVNSMLNTASVNLELFKGKKLVHISTWDTTCGIAAYCRAIKEGLDALNIFEKNDVISINPAFVHHATYEDNKSFYNDAAERAKDYDIILVQYEFGFFASDKYCFPKDVELFYNFIKKLSSQNPDAQILIYIHTSLNVLGYKNALDFFKVSEKFVELGRMKNVCFMANTINLITDWYSCGIRANLGIDPVKQFYKDSLFVNEDLKKDVIKQLEIKEGDVVLMMLGFINPMKRYDEMAEILALLPENYKLLAAGGIFPDSPKKYLTKFQNKIKSLNLGKRVYITGLFKDEDLGTYFDIADIMCAPYARVRSGSGSIPMLLLAEKPVIAYKTDMIDMINSQCDFKPVIEVEYDNRQMFADKIKELSEKGGCYLQAYNRIKEYSSLINNDKLAKLVLKTLEEKCLQI